MPTAKVRQRHKPNALARQRELDAIAKKQGYKPLRNVQELYGNFWPANESADDFVATVKKWRAESKVRT